MSSQVDVYALPRRRMRSVQDIAPGHAAEPQLLAKHLSVSRFKPFPRVVLLKAYFITSLGF